MNENRQAWLDRKNIVNNRTQTDFLRTVGLTKSSLTELVKYLKSKFDLSTWFNDPNKWLSSLVFFPINFYINKEPVKQYLSLDDVTVGTPKNKIPAYSLEGNVGNTVYYTLGEYHYLGEWRDFRDYNGYSTVQIYLPYYGYIQINPNDVIGKYIQFRLKLDLRTGQGIYYIGVSNNSITHPEAPYVNDYEDADVVILATYVCQIGTVIPLSSTGAQEQFRNILLGTVKVATSIAVANTLQGTTGGPSTSTKTKQVKNPKTGRLNIVSKTTTTSEGNGDLSKFLKFRVATDAVETAAEVATQAQNISVSDKVTNSSLMSIGPSHIKIIIRSPKYVTDGTLDYLHMYGAPLGRIDLIGNYTGFTKITDVHLDGELGVGITNNEKEMIKDLLADGIIL